MPKDMRIKTSRRAPYCLSSYAIKPNFAKVVLTKDTWMLACEATRILEILMSNFLKEGHPARWRLAKGFKGIVDSLAEVEFDPKCKKISREPEDWKKDISDPDFSTINDDSMGDNSSVVYVKTVIKNPLTSSVRDLATNAIRCWSVESIPADDNLSTMNETYEDEAFETVTVDSSDLSRSSQLLSFMESSEIIEVILHQKIAMLTEEIESKKEATPSTSQSNSEYMPSNSSSTLGTKSSGNAEG